MNSLANYGNFKTFMDFTYWATFFRAFVLGKIHIIQTIDLPIAYFALEKLRLVQKLSQLDK
jgi:hypothetical protein